ncbi:MAG: hypothetical protein CSA79_03150 [Thiothrix nivea]|nr:MAG: hypothetical protein CSA79_03150 [Thiothrix nivea]
MNEVLEYLFFTRKIADTFIIRLQDCGLVYQEDIEPVQGAIVLKIAESITDELWDELDDHYDELSEQDQALLEVGMEDTSAQSAAGVYLQLADGRQTLAAVDPQVMNCILSVLSMDEFNQFVDVIVRSVENPDDAAICQR